MRETKYRLKSRYLVRKTARILSEIHPVSKTSVWNWIEKFEEKLPVSAERK